MSQFFSKYPFHYSWNCPKFSKNVPLLSKIVPPIFPKYLQKICNLLRWVLRRKKMSQFFSKYPSHYSWNCPTFSKNVPLLSEIVPPIFPKYLQKICNLLRRILRRQKMSQFFSKYPSHYSWNCLFEQVWKICLMWI